MKLEFNLKQYNLSFHYNHYKEQWHCFHRDEYNEYFNGGSDNTVGSGDSPEEAYITSQDIIQMLRPQLEWHYGKRQQQFPEEIEKMPKKIIEIL